MTLSRTGLLQTIVGIFSEQPEISRLVAFGRQATGTTDDYSDIDLMICSDDLRMTQQNYKRLLGEISPVLGSYYLRLTETELVEMILLEGMSPYQKIDLSISADLSDKEAFAPFKDLYCRKSESTPSLSRINTAIKYDKKVNELNDRLFSIPRFTKTLHRGDQLEAYRRWQATINEYLRILMNEYLGEIPDRLLQPVAFKKLAAKLSGEDRATLEAVLPAARTFSIAHSFERAMSEIIRYHSKPIRDNPQEAFYRVMMLFLKDESGLFVAQV